MKKPIYVVLLFLFVWVSCSKYDLNIEPAAETPVTSDIKASSLLSEENLIAVKKTLTAYVQSKNDIASRGSASGKGVNFITPFLTSDGVAFLDPLTFTFVIFETELDSNDFYRENNDGSVSVHVTSNNATARYIKFSSEGNFSGEHAHFSANYTGYVSKVPVYDGEGNVIGEMKMIDVDHPIRALSIHANGKVKYNGAGPIYNLIASSVKNSKGVIKSEFTLKKHISSTVSKTPVEKH